MLLSIVPEISPYMDVINKNLTKYERLAMEEDERKKEKDLKEAKNFYY